MSPRCKWCDCPIPEEEDDIPLCRARDGDLCEERKERLDPKPVRKEMTPCYCRKMRVKVDLFLDIPGRLVNRLSKHAIRGGDVHVEGARWETASYHCPDHGIVRLGQVRVEQKVSVTQPAYQPEEKKDA